VDAIYAPPCLLFQMTVSASHTVNCQGLKLAIDALMSAVTSPVSSPSKQPNTKVAFPAAGPATLVLGVPPEVFEKWLRPQSYVDGSKKSTLKDIAALSRVTQIVLCLDD
jgi:hypothetical protein